MATVTQFRLTRMLLRLKDVQSYIINKDYGVACARQPPRYVPPHGRWGCRWRALMPPPYVRPSSSTPPAQQ
jgi:hypothetical protein